MCRKCSCHRPSVHSAHRSGQTIQVNIHFQHMWAYTSKLGCEGLSSYKTSHTSGLVGVLENSETTRRVYSTVTNICRKWISHRPSVHSAHRSGQTIQNNIHFQHMWAYTSKLGYEGLSSHKTSHTSALVGVLENSDSTVRVYSTVTNIWRLCLGHRPSIHTAHRSGQTIQVNTHFQYMWAYTSTLGCEGLSSHKTSHTSALVGVLENSDSTIGVYSTVTNICRKWISHRPSVHSAHRSGQTIQVNIHFQHMWPYTSKLGCERLSSQKTSHTSGLVGVLENSDSTSRVYSTVTNICRMCLGHRPSVHSAHRSGQAI
jgi:hemerythrin